LNAWSGSCRTPPLFVCRRVTPVFIALIPGDPRNPDMRKTLNLRIKYR
jgi:hypothetical protein